MINSTVSKTSYDAQSGVLEYPIGFQYMTNGLTGAPELKVKVDGLEAEFGRDFNVTSDKGHISFFVEPAVGAKIEIIRTTSRLQESDYQYGRINPEQIEKDFDRLTMRDQELTQSDEDIGARIDASVAEIAAEITAAKARISVNEGNISWLDGKASELEGAISEEAENRAHDDGILLEKIEQLNERNEDYREEAQNAVAAEATARAEADTNLQGAIAAEANARSTADTNLQNLISNTNNTVAAVSRAVQNVDAKVDTKQDKLVAGANIKIEGNVISAEGGGSGDVSDLENAVSVLRTDVELSTEPFTETVVLLDELYTSEIDGRPDYKKPGATVYAENGAAGIIDTVDETAGTATIVTVSAGGTGGAEFPDQTDNAGKFLQTNGSEVNWGSALVNEASGADTNLSISGGKNPITDPYGKGTNVGIGSKATGASTAFGASADASVGTYSVAVGCGAKAVGGYAVSIGFSAGTGGGSASIAIGGYAGHYSGDRSISLGHYARAKGASSVLINTAGTVKSSTTPNVFQWANQNGLYTLFDSDGTVPTDRYTTTPTTAGTYVPKLTIAEDGTATREWGAESGGSGGSGGDYLPLSGGTLTGALAFEWSGNYLTTPNTILKTKYNRLDNGAVEERDILTVNPVGEVTFKNALYCANLRPDSVGGKDDLGAVLYYFRKTFTKSLNAGRQDGVDSGDLIVPTTAGTLARIEDIDAAVGDISTALTAIIGE